MSDDVLAARLAEEVRGAEGVVALYPTGRRLLGATLPGGLGAGSEVRVQRRHLGTGTDVALSIGVEVAGSSPHVAALVRDLVLDALVAEGHVPGTVTVRVATVG